jgi:hypothetical protein
MRVTEAEVFEGMFVALDSIISLVSLFFAIVSGYLAALYFFLGQAQFGRPLWLLEPVAVAYGTPLSGCAIPSPWRALPASASRRWACS